jgi:hypothetical protein
MFEFMMNFTISFIAFNLKSELFIMVFNLPSFGAASFAGDLQFALEMSVYSDLRLNRSGPLDGVLAHLWSKYGQNSHNNGLI